MKAEMKQVYKVTFVSAFVVLILAYGIHFFLWGKETNRTMKVGFVYVGDTSTAYTNNFVQAQEAIQKKYAGQVETIAKYNVSEENVEEALKELVEEGCGLIFTTSYGYDAVIIGLRGKTCKTGDSA